MSSIAVMFKKLISGSCAFRRIAPRNAVLYLALDARGGLPAAADVPSVSLMLSPVVWRLGYCCSLRSFPWLPRVSNETIPVYAGHLLAHFEVNIGEQGITAAVHSNRVDRRDDGLVVGSWIAG